MRRPHLTQRAREDIENIRRYTLRVHGAEQADRYLSGLREKLNLLAVIPAMSPSIATEPSIRIGVYEKHRILYRETARGIEVGRVLHHAQDLTRELEAYVRRVGQKRQEPAKKP